jgi:hypothetical protein
MKERNRARRLVVPSAVLLAALAITAAPAAHASDIGSGRPFGLGIILGDPTGLSGKWYINPDHAIDFAIGAGWFTGHSLRIHADYLFHFHLTSNSTFDLPLYIGVGPAFAFWYGDYRDGYWGTKEYYGDPRFGLGVRVPFGVSFQFNEVPLDLFIEVVPSIGLLPGIGFFFDWGLGLRYWF